MPSKNYKEYRDERLRHENERLNYIIEYLKSL